MPKKVSVALASRGLRSDAKRFVAVLFRPPPIALSSPSFISEPTPIRISNRARALPLAETLLPDARDTDTEREQHHHLLQLVYAEATRREARGESSIRILQEPDRTHRNLVLQLTHALDDIP